METIITTASVRIALSHQYSTFEVAMNLENPIGISSDDIKKARECAQKLANEAVNEYKQLPGGNAKVELARVEQKIKDIKKMVEKEPEPIDPKVVEEIKNLPPYSSTKSK